MNDLRIIGDGCDEKEILVLLEVKKKMYGCVSRGGEGRGGVLTITADGHCAARSCPLANLDWLAIISSVVSDIARGSTWRHLDWPLSPMSNAGANESVTSVEGA